MDVRFSVPGNPKNEDARRRALLFELRRQGIVDERVLEAMSAIPRSLFVEPELRDSAWKNVALAIPHRQTISQPFVVALMTQALGLNGSERVLEVGTGSGYQAAILARLVREVITIERISELAATAVERFELLGIRNVTSFVGDGSQGWEPAAPYDAIMVTAGARKAPGALFEQLRSDGGRMVMPVGWRINQHLKLFRKVDGVLDSTDLGGVRFVPLIAEPEENLQS
jgi:protein-L-isoaspartate(D-aspartate) O-methyltransferase